MVVSAREPPTREPEGGALVARLRRRGERDELFVALGEGSVRCAGCGRELAPDGCFSLRRFTAAPGREVAVCTFCEPIPADAIVESLHLLHRACEHPACAHPLLVSRLRRFGPVREHADVEWVHDRPLATWGPEAPVHRPRPGRRID